MGDVVEPIDGYTVLLRASTEFVAVFFQILCFSRVGANDYYYVVQNNQTTNTSNVIQTSSKEPSLEANLVLFVTLVVFQFPYLNGYIVFMYETCVLGRISNTFVSFLRVLLCFFLVGFQLAGVAAAHAFIWAVQNTQKPWKGTITWLVPNAKGLSASDSGRDLGVELLEEFVAVTALLIGYVHLTYLNFEYGKEPAVKLFRSPVHLFATIPKPVQQLAIPLPFILQVTLLVAGLLRAFPSAHLSPHISLYIALMGYSTWEAFWFRMLGGILAFMVAYMLFWGAYVRRTRVHKDANGEDGSRELKLPLLAQAVNNNVLSRANSIRSDAPASRSDSMRSINPNPESPPPLKRSSTVASAGREESVHNMPQTISFNNAYRHVYRAI